MNTVNGGFTEHDRYNGFRALCGCGWVGPWRGLWLTRVERDVLEHRPNCPERVCWSGRIGAHNETVPSGATNAHSGPRRPLEGQL